MLIKTNVTTSSQQRRCPLLVCTGSAAELRRRKIPSCCLWRPQFERLVEVPPTDWSKASSHTAAFVTALNLIVRTEPRSVPRGNFCAGSDRKWDDEQCYSTWRWVHAVPPRAEKRGRENKPVRWGSTAKHYRTWAGPHRICFRGTFGADFRNKSVGLYGIFHWAESITF